MWVEVHAEYSASDNQLQFICVGRRFERGICVPAAICSVACQRQSLNVCQKYFLLPEMLTKEAVFGLAEGFSFV